MRPHRTLRNRMTAIEWLILDVDGVLTDGSITYDQNGNELKTFHVQDGLGLKLWHQLGKRSAIITGRSSNAVSIRAAELGISIVYQSVGDKLDVLRKIVAKHGNNAEQIAAIGDDLPDIGMLMASGLAVAVADAPNELRKRADYITRRPGGRGAVREVIDLLLKAQGRWDECVRNFETPIAGHLSGIQG